MKLIRKFSILLIAEMIDRAMVYPTNTVQAELLGCANSSPSSGKYAVTVCIPSTFDGFSLSGNATTIQLPVWWARIWSKCAEVDYRLPITIATGERKEAAYEIRP